MDDKNMSVTEHLSELRRVFLVSFIAVFIASVIIYLGFRERILEFFLQPVKDMEVSFVFVGMTEAFLTKIKLSVLAGFIIALPVVSWQVWSFIVPALRPNEKKFVYILVPISLVLFVCGIVFAYTTVFHLAARFLLVEAGEGLQPMIAISKYISFIIYFLLPFGIVFQLPLVVAFLSRTGIVTAKALSEKRKHAILVIFTVAAILTPPDIISQILLAGPVLVLYEVSILVAKIIKPKKKPVEENA
ncbi:MAG: Sec-independent protein translocase TatC [Clostridiales bacterium]|jgi:sec-independent protein translocase protein TatC|nr:Sec-independent protein translocase TatC [Clostridiales bacterium]